jgi:hypothetical protein
MGILAMAKPRFTKKEWQAIVSALAYVLAGENPFPDNEKWIACETALEKAHCYAK